MQQCFYSLFRRGRYCRRKSLGDAERKEAERFAVAALAFTLQHDLDGGFRRHFLEVICHLPNDVAAESPDIQVERYQWADLLIRVQNYVVVIECKVNAPLGDFQNPQEETAFYRSSEGYGRRITVEFAGGCLKKHFVILGYRRQLELKNRDGLICFQNKWPDIKGATTSPLVNDLFHCLGALGIEEFQSMRSDQMKIGQNAAILALGTALLDDTCLALGLVKSEWRSDSEFESVSGWQFGVEIRQSEKGSSPIGKSLFSAVRPKDKAIGWIGYESGEVAELTVWFYCGNHAICDEFRQRCKGKRGLGNELRTWDRDGESFVYAAKPVESSSGDKEWFLSIFRELGFLV